MNTQFTTKINNRVAIVGGGAAGLFAAYKAACCGSSVTLIEKNGILGKKLNITGKGRCNVTNNCDIRTFLDNVPTNPKFLYKALSVLSPSDTIDFFETNGLPLKTERGRRVFPVSDKASDVSSLLKSLCEVEGVSFLNGTVISVKAENSVCNGIRILESGKQQDMQFDKVIIATGGKSYPKTGSDGSGYLLAARCGHKIITPKASLVPLVAKEQYCSDMMGLSLKNVTASFYQDSKCLYSELGEMLFTHFGVSGPIILSASAFFRTFPVDMRIDLKPGLDEKALDTRIMSDFSLYKNKIFGNSLDKLLPRAIIPTVVSICEIDPLKTVNSVTREERKRLIGVLKSFPVTIVATRPIEEAIITSGGIDVKEINPSTMESKLIKNLYFAGEIIDVDAYTGGYNLQIAFSTGYLAGISASQT